MLRYTRFLPAACALCVLSGVPAAGAPAVSATAWTLKTSPHFEIRHESSWAPQSVELEAERLYGKLRLSAAMFAPWMAREKTKIYIYGGRDSYMGGEFKPPPWSKGLAFSATRTIVVYDTGDMPRLRSVIAHELSHLYFESYFGEMLKYPPTWLNEGLAVMLEDLSYEGGGPWSLALKYGETGSFQPAADFFGSDPSSMDSDARISYWYLQAFGTVSYLFRPGKRIQFMNFCSLLRAGKTLDTALWESYRIGGAGDLGTKWGAWLAGYRGTGPEDEYAAPASASYDFKPVEFKKFTPGR